MTPEAFRLYSTLETMAQLRPDKSSLGMEFDNWSEREVDAAADIVERTQEIGSKILDLWWVV